jgi:hypothetical protein
MREVARYLDGREVCRSFSSSAAAVTAPSVPFDKISKSGSTFIIPAMESRHPNALCPCRPPAICGHGLCSAAGACIGAEHLATVALGAPTMGACKGIISGNWSRRIT